MVAITNARSLAIFRFSCMILLLVGSLFNPVFARDDDEETAFDTLRGFTETEIAKSEFIDISDKQKHQIMFIMGAILLVTIIGAALLGIAMVVFGKQVFLAHMILAGISVFLAIVHAVTAMVWFFPF